VKAQKNILRQQIRDRIGQLTQTEKQNQSAAIRSQLTFPPNQHIALFAGLPNEPQLLDLIREQTNVHWYLPRVLSKTEMTFIKVTDPQTLLKGPFKILEPTGNETATHLDTILCPGVAFTKSGTRLGQGGGYYDRALTQYPTAKRIGIAFTCQIIPKLPIEAHDLPMHHIISPPQKS